MSEEYYWFVFCRDELVLTDTGKLPFGSLPPVRLAEGQTAHRLPRLEGQPCLAVRVDAPVQAPGYGMAGLRAAFDVLPAAHYAMAGKAAELLHWDAATRHCGVCGAGMEWHTDISKRCTRCGREVWPSPAVAIIVLVTRGADEALLVQSNKFRGDYMGLVAGFVETGESLEECLRREVMEETGVSVSHIRYFASQPWPFPCNLMVGFTARYDGGDIRLQRSELNKGGWFRRDALPEIPGKVSLARRLIDAWIDGQVE